MKDTAEMIRALADFAWPVVALVVARMFQDDLCQILKRLRRGKLFGQEVELDQSITEHPPPPLAALSGAEADAFSHPDARKILATPWRYQKQHFPNDPSKRWTFLVRPNAPVYAQYLGGLSALVASGLVVVDPETQHAMLSNEGLAACESRAAELEALHDYYHF
jgi:hypothetical protein